MSPSESSASTDVEETLTLQPKFDSAGLVTCVTTDASTGALLMVAHMNQEALSRTIASGDAWYFSRTRNALWRKGESSGQVQRVVEMRVDCDQDAILMKVNLAGDGVACHRGYRSCFYRKVPVGTEPTGGLKLEFDKDMRRIAEIAGD